MINLLEELRSSSLVYSNATGIFPFIVQIGCGGTGGYIIQNLSQMLGTTNKAHVYCVADPDVIEEKNLKNQLFLKEEVGLKKADVLASRYSDAYGLDIGSYTEKYIESVDEIMNLFEKEYLWNLIPRNAILLPILIGSVDNNYSRQIMDQLFHAIKHIVYIDVGNESTIVPSDWQTRSKEQWTDNELEEFANSGWTGQVVIGVKINGKVLASPVATEFPDILTDEDSVQPSELSCTELSASEPQRLIVNKFAALSVTNILNELLESDSLSIHVTHFHSKKGYMRSIPITSINEIN